MTLKEATETAEKRLPVIHGGIEYLRISEAGYRYDDAGIRHPFVQLLDRCGHSVTYAEPSRVTLKEPERCSICGGEITGHGNNAAPVTDGRCCDACNMAVVVPARAKQSEEEASHE